MKNAINTKLKPVKTGPFVGRLTRKFWATTETGVELVDGYSCGTGMPEENMMWWCPAVGYSGSVGHSLFDTAKEALTNVESELYARLSDTQDALEAVRKQLRKL